MTAPRRTWLDDLTAARNRGALGSATVGYTECDCEICDHRHNREGQP